MHIKLMEMTIMSTHVLLYPENAFHLCTGKMFVKLDYIVLVTKAFIKLKMIELIRTEKNHN